MTNLPMYMGEIGHNTEEWMSAFCQVMEENNIGWTFWPYKKRRVRASQPSPLRKAGKRSFVFRKPPRSSFRQIREARPQQARARYILEQFLEACRFENNVIQKEYIRALGL